MQKGRYKVDRNMRLNDGNLMLSKGDQFNITNILEDDKVKVIFHDESFIVDDRVLVIGSSPLNLDQQLIKRSI